MFSYVNIVSARLFFYTLPCSWASNPAGVATLPNKETLQ
jgi:hypothetical protein